MVNPVPDDALLEELPLSTRARHCLLNEGYRTAGDVRAVSDGVLMRMPNFGRVSVREVRDVLGTGQPACTKPAAYLTVRLDEGMLERLRAEARGRKMTPERLALTLLRSGLG